MKTPCGPAVKGEGGIAGEGKLVGVPKLPPWDTCAMPLMNLPSDWMSNVFSGLCITV